MVVLVRVGMGVMVTVMSCPPEHSLLDSGSPEPGEHKLKQPACLIGPVGKIAMVAGRNAEHPNDVSERENCQCNPADSGPEGEQRGGVDGEKWNARLDIKPAPIVSSRRGCHESVPGRGNSRIM